VLTLSLWRDISPGGGILLENENKESIIEERQNAPEGEDNGEYREYIRRRRIVSAVSIIIFAVFILAVAWYVGRPLVSMLESPEDFRMWVNSHRYWGRLAMIGMVVLQVIVAIIPGEVMEIGAGYAFGAIEGAVLCLVGTAIGSTVVFLLTKKVGIRLVEAFITREKIDSLRFIKNSRNLNLLVFLLFLIPGTPKDVLTYFVGLTRMSLSTFLTITMIARIPSIISSTIAGGAMGDERYTTAVWVIGATMAASVIGVFIYNKISKKGRKDDKDAEEKDQDGDTEKEE